MPPKRIGKPKTQGPQAPKAVKRNAFAIVSIFLGVFSFINLAGFEKPLLAIAFGLLALKEFSKEPAQGGRNLAFIGITLGIAGVVLTAVALYYLTQSNLLECIANCTRR